MLSDFTTPDIYYSLWIIFENAFRRISVEPSSSLRSFVSITISLLLLIVIVLLYTYFCTILYKILLYKINAYKYF